jgi:hypothetical protein
MPVGTRRADQQKRARKHVREHGRKQDTTSRTKAKLTTDISPSFACW